MPGVQAGSRAPVGRVQRSFDADEHLVTVEQALNQPDVISVFLAKFERELSHDHCHIPKRGSFPQAREREVNYHNSSVLNMQFSRALLSSETLLLALIVLTSLWRTAPIQAAPVSFANSGFETFPTGGADDWDWPSDDWVWDRSVAHGGSHSARVSSSSGSATASLWSAHVPVQPSTTCTLTYWLRTQDVTAPPVVNVYQYTSAGTQTGLRLRSYMDLDGGTSDWCRISFRFQTMPDADYVRVRLFLWTDTPGTFWFDDFALDEGPLAPYPFQAGFPVIASGWINFSSPAVADIDGDGSNELLVGAGGSVNGWNDSGATLPGFPVDTGDRRILGQLALADLDSDGDLEIVAGTRAPVYGGRGRVFIWHHTGAMVDGWPQRVDWLGQYGTEFSEVASVALADVDGDGDLEVLAGTTNGAPGYSGANPPATPNLYVWHADGTLVEGSWPTWHSTAAIYGAIAAGDLTGDGLAEVITGRDAHYLYAHAADGSHLPGWPITTYVDGNDGNWNTDLRIVHGSSAPVIADLDGDHQAEYVVVGRVNGPGYEFDSCNSGVLVLEPDGARRPGWETAALGNGVLSQSYLSRQAPSVADLDGDGQLEIVVATHDGWIRAYKPDQRLLWTFDYAQGSVLFASEPVIGDIDGDQAPEVVFGTYDPAFGDGPAGLWGLEADGTPMLGFPLPVGTPGIRAAPTLADLDDDGDLEIVAAAWTGEIFVWDASDPYVPSHMPWPTGRHDLRRSATFVREGGDEPDLGDSRKFATRPAARTGETVRFVIRLQNTGTRPFTHTLRLTDTLPAGMAYVPDSLTAPSGTVTDTWGLLRWSGVMSDATTIDISYDVTITTEATALLSNTVTIDTVVDGLIARTGYVIANGWSCYLPAIMKE
jgi:uncharacterized repeat protein (TIGR01451 family)